MSIYRDKNSLVIYFSRAGENYGVSETNKGNTEYIAEFVKEIIGADLFKVEPKVPYSFNYNECCREAKERIGNAPIKEYINDISNYEVIYIMTPIYWGTYAPEVETILKSLDFKDKVIRIITTHEGSGLGNVLNDVKRVCKNGNVLDDTLSIQGSKCKNSYDIVNNWL